MGWLPYRIGGLRQHIDIVVAGLQEQRFYQEVLEQGKVLYESYHQQALPAPR